MADIYKAVLVVSISMAKTKGLNAEARRERARALAKHLVNQPGVTQVEPIVFRRWIIDPKDSELGLKATWEPVGAVVTVEADDDKTLQGYVDGVHNAASKFDQTTLVTNGVNGWRKT